MNIIEQRMPHDTASQAVLDECDQRGFEIFVAWHGLATVFYITAKKRGELYAMQMMRGKVSDELTLSPAGSPDTGFRRR
ncbi:hypothetical protein [Prosthecobacter debontii]|uniref:hypothetical protein n=1 Tax=Prosthecobacter debontii TaxID=48467 RepID=UPI00111799FB|nr:hypothetical protein [Prosthecobacter debontii]